MVKHVLQLHSAPQWNMYAYIPNNLKTILLTAFQYFLYFDLGLFPLVFNRTEDVASTSTYIHWIKTNNYN